MNGKYLVGKTKDGWEYVQRQGNTIGKSDAVVIIGTTEENEYILIKETRKAIEEHAGTNKIISFPAGLMDLEDDNALETAKREMLEETGYEITEVESVSPIVYNTPGMVNESCVIVGCKVKHVGEQDLQDSEEIEVLVVSEDKIEELFSENIVESKVMTYFMSSLKTR